MLLDDNEQQLSRNSFQSTPIDLSSVLIRRDEFSEIITNMTKTLHLNTPEQTMSHVDIDDNDNNKGNKQQQLVEQLQAQLIHNQMKRKQARNYTRILHQSNTPAHWYKAPSTNRSVYFYDPNYQKYIHQRTNSPPKIKPKVHPIPPQPSRIQDHLINHSNSTENSWFSITPRTKYMFDLYNTAVNYHKQKQRLNQNYHSTSLNISQQHFSTSSRMQSIPTLPPINTSKQRNEQEYNLSNTNE